MKLSGLTVILLLTMGLSYAQNSLQGHIHEHASKENVVFAEITIDNNTIFQSDFDGQFKTKNLSPGKHSITIKRNGYKTLVDTFQISNHHENIHFFLIKDLEASIDSNYAKHIDDKDYGKAAGGTVTREDIAKMPQRSASSVAATIATADHIGPVRGCCAPVRIPSSGCCSSVTIRGCCARTTRYYDDSNVYHNQRRQLQEGYGQKIKKGNLQEMRALKLN